MDNSKLRTLALGELEKLASIEIDSKTAHVKLAACKALVELSGESMDVGNPKAKEELTGLFSPIPVTL